MVSTSEGNHINTNPSHKEPDIGQGKTDDENNMGSIKCRGYTCLLLLLLCLSESSVLGKVHVMVMNRLGQGRVMNIHCRSGDNDLGGVAVLDGGQINWKFYVNFWGTTLFYCDVQWGDSQWERFDAYSYERDSSRCETQCFWMISEDGLLYSYNNASGNWNLMPFKDRNKK